MYSRLFEEKNTKISGVCKLARREQPSPPVVDACLAFSVGNRGLCRPADTSESYSSLAGPRPPAAASAASLTRSYLEDSGSPESCFLVS